MRRSAPGATLRYNDLADVSDLGTAMRLVLRYSGQMPIEGAGTRAVTGEVRQYYHANGAATLEALCFSELSACPELSSLVSQAERTLLAQLGGSGVGGILPQHGECSIEPMTNLATSKTSDAARCLYPPGTVLSFARLNAEETRAALEVVAQDPELKRLMRDTVESAIK